MSRARTKVVELAAVTDHDLEAAINRAGDEGWELSRIDYIREHGVRRPQMAFLFFSRTEAEVPPPGPVTGASHE